MKHALITKAILGALLATVCSGGSTAIAADGMDYFYNKTPGGVKSPGTGNQSASTNFSPDQLALAWFEKFDDIIFTMGPSDHEKFILKRPINQELERVREWIAANDSMSKKYRNIARRIRALPISKSISDVKEYQIETSSWYDDSAEICEELTAPRPPAKTAEELDRAFQSFKRRAGTLREVSKVITELDIKLRQKYDVHPPKYTDPAEKFVDSVANRIKE